jgi:hypothetical protein
MVEGGRKALEGHFEAIGQFHAVLTVDSVH